MNIQQLPLSDLHPYARNPRKNDGAVQAVAESIRQFGFKNPIIVDKNNVVVCGHTRLLAAKELGMEKVPCIVADDLSEEQIKAFRLVDNKTGELAEWDVELLPLELADISADLSVYGFDIINDEGFDSAFTLDNGGKKPFQQISLTLHNKQAELLLAAIASVYEKGEVSETFGNENKNGNGIYEVVRQWAEQKKLL